MGVGFKAGGEKTGGIRVGARNNATVTGRVTDGGRRWQSRSRIQNLRYGRAAAIGKDKVKGMAVAVTGCGSISVTTEAQSFCSFSKRRPHMASSD